MAFSWLGSRRNKKTSNRAISGAAKRHAFKPLMERLEDRLNPTPGVSIIQFHITPPSGDPVTGSPTPAFGGVDVITTEPTTGTSQVTITVDRITDPGDTVALNTDVSATYATEDETGIAGTNYTQTTGTVTIPAGQTSATFTVDILHVGTLADGGLPGNKVFGIGLTNPSAEATLNPLADQSAITIKDSGGTQNQRYINDVFFELLNRPADPGALNFFAPQLAAGTSKEAICLQIEGSVNANGRNEYNDNQTNIIYQEFLGRDATLNELNAAQALLTNNPTTGSSLQAIKANVIASADYFTKAGATDVGFVQSMYRDILNRNPDQGGQNFYLSIVSSQGRLAAVSDMLGQVEAIDDLLVNYYTIYLNRPADQPGQTFYRGELQANAQLQLIINQFLGSTNEYFDGV